MNLRTLTILLSLSSLLIEFTHAQNQYFEKDVVKADLEYLYNALQEAHFNVYAYTSKEEFEEAFLRVKNDIREDTLELLEVTSLYQRLVSKINNGHTEIDFPGASYAQYAYAGGTLFPLEIAFEEGQCLIRKNFSSIEEIKTGDEITHINGQSMEEILDAIYPQLSAERAYFKNAKIELYSFPRLYWQVFGQIDSFDVQIKKDEQTQSYALNAVNLIEGYEMKREEVMNAQMNVQFYNDVAYLNPGHFSGDETKYKLSIDSAFLEINKVQPANLIIDLRNNFGGNNSFSDYLVSYIANKPFQWNSRLSIRSSKFLKEHVRKYNDTTDVYFQEILSRNDGEIYDYHFDDYKPQPAEKRFVGKVYVLVNRQSHSQAAVTAAQIQDYDFGIIVGEETGEYPTLYASQFQFTLPNTGILVKVSKGQIVRVNGSLKKEGVIPDIYIQDHLLDEEDEILNELIKKINGE